MDKKKILIISRSFYPMLTPRSFRTTELVKEFSRKGHHVVLLTHKIKEHENFEKEFNITIVDLGKTIFPTFKLGGNKYLNLLKRVISRSLNLFFEYPNIELMFLVNKALKNEKKYDLLISIASPHPTHWGVAMAYHKNIAKTWVADCGDPFMLSYVDSFKKLFYFKYVEKWWSRKANFITIPILGAIDAYYKEFHHKIKIIPQGFDFSEVKIDSYKQNKIPTFAYIGILIPRTRDPRPFIKYLLELKIEFKFILYNNQKEMYLDLIKESNGMVEFRDYIERKILLKFLSKMDFLVNFNNGVSTQLPSKLIDYYLTKRPILSLDSYNIDKETISQFLECNFINQYKYKDMNQYNISNVCSKFISLCNQ